MNHGVKRKGIPNRLPESIRPHSLGYNKNNMGDLAKQIQFDPSKAVPTQLTEFGQKFNQIIPINGANGRVIDVNFAWIRNNDGIVRLVTGVPAK
jgi:filamentous hemagglutinin